MKKWTEYYGRICRVKLNQNEKGEFEGYSWNGVGSSWITPLKELPPDQFWDTKEEALAGVKFKLEYQLAELRVVNNYLHKQIEIVKEMYDRIEKRIPNLESEVSLIDHCG